MTENVGRESRACFDQDMMERETVEVCGGSTVVYSARCPGKETANEDAAAILLPKHGEPCKPDDLTFVLLGRRM